MQKHSIRSREGGLATPGSSRFPLLRGQVALRNSVLSLGIIFPDCKIERSEGAQISFQQCLKAAIESKSPLGAQKELVHFCPRHEEDTVSVHRQGHYYRLSEC